MDINLVELWSQMGLPVKGVVIVLTLQAIASLTVVVDRLFVLLRSERASRAFAKKIAPAMEKDDWETLVGEASRSHGSHLAGLVHAGLTTFLGRRDRGDSYSRAAELSRRALERKGASLSDDLNRGMNVLATTGSTAPFVGLLGTVLGIIHAFHQIAAEGSGGIGTIGGSIGEALIVTGYGLIVAIPTVLLFNWLSGRIGRFELGLTNAANELLDRLEGSEPVAAVERRETHEVAEHAAETSKPKKVRLEDLPAPAQA